MKGSKAFYLLAVVSAVLIIGVAYAAIQDIPLTVSGTASSGATSEGSHFNVEFTGGALDTENSKSGLTTSFDGTAGQTGKFTVSGLTEVGDKATIVFTIENKSTDLEAVLNGSTKAITASVEGATTYFDVSDATFESTRLGVANSNTDSTTLTLAVELLKPSVSGKSVTVEVSFNATAVDPQ